MCMYARSLEIRPETLCVMYARSLEFRHLSCVNVMGLGKINPNLFMIFGFNLCIKALGLNMCVAGMRMSQPPVYSTRE